MDDEPDTTRIPEKTCHPCLGKTMQARWWWLGVLLLLLYVWTIDDEDLDYDYYDDYVPELAEPTVQSEDIIPGNLLAFQSHANRHRDDSELAVEGNDSLLAVKLDGISPNHNVYGLHEFGIQEQFEDITDSPVANETAVQSNTTGVQLSEIQDTVTQEPEVLRPPSVERWQAIDEYRSYVFSAHRDPRHPSRTIVYLFGIMLTRLLRVKDDIRLYCHLVTAEFGIVDTVLGNIRTVALREYKYEGFILQCKFDPGSYVYNDSFVSIVRGAWDVPMNALNIRDNLHDTTAISDFTLCSSEIIHNTSGEHAHFVEWMEMNLILGVRKVILYVSRADDVMAAIMDSYKRDGVLEVVDLSGLVPNVWKYASFISMQECLFRTMLRTRHLMYLDIDELIAPRHSKLRTLNQMLVAAKCTNKTYVAALNYFYHPDWPDDEKYANNETIRDQLQLRTLLKTQRESSFLRFENRSRFITRPENVDHVKPHKVWLRHQGSEYPCVIHPDIGALHHYDQISSLQGPAEEKEQSPDEDEADQVTANIQTVLYQKRNTDIRDRNMHKYEAILIRRTADRYWKLGI